MKKKRIQFSLVYRDMWQSSGKYQPRKDQLERVAPAIIDMGCFSRVETNGGAFEQVNLLYGENPNLSQRSAHVPCPGRCQTLDVQGQEKTGYRYHPYLRWSQ